MANNERQRSLPPAARPVDRRGNQDRSRRPSCLEAAGYILSPSLVAVCIGLIYLVSQGKDRFDRVWSDLSPYVQSAGRQYTQKVEELGRQGGSLIVRRPEPQAVPTPEAVLSWRYLADVPFAQKLGFGRVKEQWTRGVPFKLAIIKEKGEMVIHNDVINTFYNDGGDPTNYRKDRTNFFGFRPPGKQSLNFLGESGYFVSSQGSSAGPLEPLREALSGRLFNPATLSDSEKIMRKVKEGKVRVFLKFGDDWMMIDHIKRVKKEDLERIGKHSGGLEELLDVSFDPSIDVAVQLCETLRPGEVGFRDPASARGDMAALGAVFENNIGSGQVVFVVRGRFVNPDPRLEKRLNEALAVKK